MAPRRFRNRSFWAITALALLGPAGVCAGIGLIVWDGLTPAESTLLGALLQRHVGEIVGLAVIGVVIAALAVDWVYRLYVLPLDHLADEASAVFDSAPERRVRLHGSREAMRLAQSLNRAAERVQRLRRSLDERILLSSSRARSETGVLSVVVAELAEGVVICNPEGLITLYNESARRLLSADEPPRAFPEPGRFGCFLGLGRSVLGVLEKPVLDHVIEDLEDQLRRGQRSPRSTVLVTACRGGLMRLEAAPILGSRREVGGYVLVFSDVTRQLDALHDATSRIARLAHEARASADAIRRALGDDATGPGAVRACDALDRLSLAVEQASADWGRTVPYGLPLALARLTDIVAGVQRRARSSLGLTLPADIPADLWVRLDGYSFSLALVAILMRLRDHGRSRELRLSATAANHVIGLEFRWQGEALSCAAFGAWAEQRLITAEGPLPMTLNGVFARFGIEAAPLAPDADGPGLRIELAAAEPAGADAAARTTLLPVNRPVFYDFDLFRERRTGLGHRPLSDLAYTVFDTETTGLDPAGGDEIIAIGAVRIVNRRMLPQETFEQLVKPHRAVPVASIRVHGIPPRALAHQPRIEQVLPLFYRYAEGTVLVAHNAAFDLRMLQTAETRTGIRFDHPVLDTMLLSAVVQPAQDSHGLEAIAARLGVSVLGRHTALGDAVATAEIFLKLLPLLEAMGLRTLEQAQAASRRTAEARLRY